MQGEAVDRIQDIDDGQDQIRQAVQQYSRACQVPCRAIDSFGKTILMSAPRPQAVRICDLACKILPHHLESESSDDSPICRRAHLYGSYQAERFGGQYVYFCPLGLTHWSAPIVRDGQVIGALLGGPVHMVDPDDFLADELAMRGGLHESHRAKLQKCIKQVDVLDTQRVHAMSEILSVLAESLSDSSFHKLKEKKAAGDLQTQLFEQISFMKAYAQQENDVAAYPIEKEEKLIDLIEMGDKAGSQQILNEIMGHIFFASGGSIEIIQARVIELVVLLSRAAIRGGADTEQIFGLNPTYLRKINRFQNIDEIAYWLSGILARFTDQVFDLSKVKHADVIYRAVNYIRRNYMKKITLEATAAHVFLSSAYFSRVFKEEMGENFNVYVNRVRVEAAKKLLLNEKIALVDVSTLVGFEGQSYFSKVFKKVTGVTPGKYRESRGKTKPLQ